MNTYNRDVCRKMNILAMKAACGEDVSIFRLFYNEIMFARVEQ